MGSGNIKGITITFSADTKKLDKELREVEKKTRGIDKELNAVNKALKFNPTSIELWREKQNLLNQKITETKKKLDILKKQQKAMEDAGVDKQSVEYQKLQRQIIETESKLKSFKKELKQIEHVNLKVLSEQFKKAGDALQEAGRNMKELSMAGAAVVATLGTMTAAAAKNADQLNTLSKRYGISTKELQKYALTAGLVDVDLETVTKSHVKLEKTMYSAAQGSKTNAAYFEKLGVSITDANGELRSSDEVFNDTIAALGKMENETERDAVAMALMGKSAAELNPLIEDGGKTYAETAALMQKYGLDFIDQETLDKSNEFQDKIDQIKLMGTLAYQTLGAKLAEYLLPALEKVVDWVGRLANWLSNLDPRLLTIIGAIGGVVAAAAPLLIGLGKMATGVSALINLIGVIGPAIAGIVAALGPVVLAIGSVIAIGVLLYKNWDTIKARAIAFKDKVINTFNQFKAKVTSIFNAVKNAIVTPIQSAIDIVKNAIERIKSIINGAKLQLPKFKLPHFKINGGKLPWGIGGQGTPPKISVDWYAKGGIFDAASIIGVGEKGPEAVVPLDTLWKKLDAIAAAGGGGATVINVYGSDNMSVNELAAEVERRIIQQQKRRTLAWQ